MTSEIKKEIVNVLNNLLAEHQKKRALVTDDMVKEFMKVRPLHGRWTKK